MLNVQKRLHDEILQSVSLHMSTICVAFTPTARFTPLNQSVHWKWRLYLCCSAVSSNMQHTDTCNGFQGAFWWCPRMQRRFTKKCTPSSAWTAALWTWRTVPPSTKQVRPLPCSKLVQHIHDLGMLYVSRFEWPVCAAISIWWDPPGTPQELTCCPRLLPLPGSDENPSQMRQAR